jgi:hypothetical protein
MVSSALVAEPEGSTPLTPKLIIGHGYESGQITLHAHSVPPQDPSYSHSISFCVLQVVSSSIYCIRPYVTLVTHSTHHSLLDSHRITKCHLHIYKLLVI